MNPTHARWLLMEGEATGGCNRNAPRTLKVRTRLHRAGPRRRHVGVRSAVVCVLMILCGGARSRAADCAVPPYAATYSVQARGVEVAQIRQTLETASGPTYRFASSLDVHLLFHFRAADQLSVGSLASGRLVRRGGFRFTEHRPLGSHEDVLAAGEYDPLSYQLALREDLLFQTANLSYRVRDGSGVEVYAFVAVREPTPLATALGTLAVVRADRQDPHDERVSFWFAPQLGYLLVQTRLDSPRYGVVRGAITTYEPQSGSGCVIEGPPAR